MRFSCAATWYQANLISMDPVIVASARKHGISDSDMLHAYRNPIRVFQMDDLVMLIGGDESGRMLENRRRRRRRHRVHRPRNARAREIPEVISMPRSIQEILDHADELAKRFEDYDPARAIRCRWRNIYSDVLP